LNEISISSKSPHNTHQIDLNLSVENKKQNIKFNVDKMNVFIEECESNQIIMYDKHGYYHCENPICKSCSDTTAVCLKSDSNIENINDPNLNKCICMDGWIGDLCENRDFVQLK